MAQKEKIRKDIRDFITKSFLTGDENENLSDSDSFMKEGIIDSTGVLELVSFLEKQYGFAVKDDEMTPGNLDSIDNLVIFISGKLG
jgi:acyl carrier protein